MENKYYTPELKEFYIGFEYEYLALGLYEDGPEPFWGWYKRTYEDDENYIFTEKRDESFLRVKYLDQQGIESFGFEVRVVEKTFPDVLNYKKLYKDARKEHNLMCLHYNLVSKWALITTVNDGDEQDPFYHSTRFCGYVKNKSELKRLMDMLQINP